MKKLKQILSKEEIEKIRIILKEKLAIPTSSWSHAMAKNRIGGLLEELDEISYPDDLWQLREFIPRKKENKTIKSAISKLLEEEHSDVRFPW